MGDKWVNVWRTDSKDAAMEQIVSNGRKNNLLHPSSWNISFVFTKQEVCTSVLAAGFVCFQIESDSVADANDIEGHTHILFF